MYLCLLWVFLIVFEMLFKLCFEGVYIDYDDIFWISNNIVKYRNVRELVVGKKDFIECWIIISIKVFGKNFKVF